MLTFGSLFAGIGGFDAAMERAGMQCRWQVEIDRDANGVLARHFPKVKRHADIREVGRSNLEPVDLVCGGFPCQDLSVAGKRAGLSGGRSGLFWEIVRLLDELSPRWVLLENVPGLLSSHGGRDFGAVLGALVQRGYGVAYRILDAQFFGVPQRRRRVFIVGCLGEAARAAQVLFESGSCAGNPPPSREAGAGVAGNSEVGFGVSGTLGGGSGRRGFCDDFDRSGAFIPIDMRQASRGEKLTNSRSCGSGEVAPAMGAGSTKGQGSIAVAFNIVGLAQQGNNHAYETEIAGCLQHKGLKPTGNEAGTVISFKETQSGCYEGRVNATLDANKGSRRQEGILSGMTVRRLTPLECERLQGFPDGWTEKNGDGKTISDSARYRMLGNAVACPVVEWIARRIAEVNE